MMNLCRTVIAAILAVQLALATPALADAAPAAGAANQSSHVDSSSIAEWLKKKKRN